MASDGLASTPAGPLAGVRIVEVAEGIVVPYAARLLADLGADVLKLESDPGDNVRRRGPFRDNHTGADDGALFHLLNASKLGATVSGDDRDAVSRVLAGADIVLVDALGRGLLEAAGIDLGALPVNVVIGTGCDVHGRPDLGAMHACAVSGVSSMIGDPGRRPLPLPYDVASYVGGANLAGAVLGGMVNARRTGIGQHVEVASADVLFYFMDVIGCLVTLGADRVFRNGRVMPGSGGVYPFRFFECRDGVVAVTCRTDRDWTALVEIVGRTEWLADPEWRDPRIVARRHSTAADAVLEPWFRERSVDELFERALTSGLPMAPVRTIGELVAEREHAPAPQVEAAGVNLPIVRNPARFRRTPAEALNELAPVLGARLVSEVVDRWRDEGRRENRSGETVGPASDRLLDGLRVVDLAWVWSGPMVSASLSDLGADVVKVEHRARLDNTRLRGRPVLPGRELPENAPAEEVSLYNHLVNRGKRSITLDIKHPDGARVLRELLQQADVVIENLPPDTFERRGLGYDDVAAENPGLIWMAMRSIGGDGPTSALRAYAPVMSSLAGIEGLVGYRGEAPVGMINFALADPNASSYATLAILAALIERTSSGLGQYVEMSQVDALMSTLCEPFGIVAMTGVDPTCSGDRHPVHVPSGHYAAAGDDAWVAVVVRTPEEWNSLVAAVGDDSLRQPEFVDLEVRRAHIDWIDEILEAWTRTRPAEFVVDSLTAAGVPVAEVLRFEESRSHFVDRIQHVDHPYIPDEEVVGLPWRYSRTPSRVERPAPLIGEHTREVLAGLPGLAGDQDDLMASSGLT